MNQFEMKKKAYQSTLKSRALQVFVYLIDRANKEGTCFPSIPTISRELHISISTVKRALHELTESGYVKKESRFREKNGGQTSNLYTLSIPEDEKQEREEKCGKVNRNSEAEQRKCRKQEKQLKEDISIPEKEADCVWTGEGFSLAPPGINIGTRYKGGKEDIRISFYLLFSKGVMVWQARQMERGLPGERGG